MKLQKSESGIVSIVVTMIMMIVLTLIVIGFAQLSRREQEQALDRQLNTQAFYAAESAVNDAKELIQSNPSVLNQDYVTDCGAFMQAPPDPLPDLNPVVGSNASYTCLLVDPTPTMLDYPTVETTKSKIIPIQAKDPAETIHSLTFEWKPVADEDNNHVRASCPAATTFPENWPADCKVGILRVNVLPYDSNMNRTQLIDQTLTAFFTPHETGSGLLGYTAAKGPSGVLNLPGVIRPGRCSVNGRCSVQIFGISARNVYVRLLSIARSNHVSITARDIDGNILEISGAQAVIDATGKASDVLRRIQVRTQLNGASEFPEYALQTRDGICKRYAVAPTTRVLIEANGNDLSACAF